MLGIGGKKQELEKDYCIIGLNEFGYAIGKILMGEEQNVTVIEKDTELLNRWGTEFTNSSNYDAMQVKDLQDLGVQDFDYVIVCIDDIEESISICSNLKELGVENILARAKNKLHQKVLKLIGVDHSFIPEFDIVKDLVYQTMFGLKVDRLSFGASSNSPSEELFSIRMEVENPQLWGRTAASLSFLRENEATLVSIKRVAQILIPVLPEETLKEGDIVLLVSRKEHISNLKNLFEYGATKDNN
ncbi:potassium channel family protein [Candidatus Mycoplasma haematominutum]|uniref:Potassium uptake protein KtrA n=1 Tax=Candidatus Mycoplasma haematominutum 'Birmingham 1' TaxID=1116213 RepID=G8C366_9MOLU|nr:TrkA family potassium uptake protein [Candidatus Mycoplasma haematominutum]CCE66764.1 potassium uptake protein KtrA [Candidatus Mycoplasma haematominutum 'Birmingham 1']